MATDPTGRPPEGDWLGTAHLRFERSGPLARCVINRPAKRNALTASMYFGIRYAINHTDADDELAGLLITGTDDVFSSGGDLSWEGDDAWADLTGLLFLDNVPFEAIRQSRKPVVSAVNGLCQGGGLVIAMLSDVAVVSERATFRAPELFRGIADTHYAHILSRQVGPARARDLLMTGRVLDAHEAVAWGMVARCRPARRAPRRRPGRAGGVLSDRTGRPARGEAHARRLLRPIRPHGHGAEPAGPGDGRGIPRLQRAPDTGVGAPRLAARGSHLNRRRTLPRRVHVRTADARRAPGPLLSVVRR